MDIALELFSTTSPGTVLESRSTSVADAWELETERAAAIASFDAHLATHGARLRVRTTLAASTPVTLLYSRLRVPLDT